MSLFGNTLGGGSNQPSSGAPATSSSSSLFGAKPPFGGTPVSSSATSSNLFGSLNIGGATAASSATPQPASTGPAFGGLFSAKTTAPGSASTPALTLGGTSTAQSKPNTFPSLFQNSTSQAPQQSASINPLSNTQQTTAAGQSTLFSTSTAPQQQQQQQQQQQPGGPLSQSNNGSGKTAHFDHLLERSRKRNAGGNGLGTFEELPSLQLGLGDIARKVRNLGTGGPSADQAQDRAAHYLLSASGVKLGSTLRDLNQFSTQTGISTTGPAINHLDTDVDSYISNLHSQSTLALIQEGLEQSKRDFDLFLEENVQIEWDQQRKRIYEHFGLGRQSEEAEIQSTFGSTVARGAFGRSTRKGRSTAGKGPSANGASFGASGAPPVIGSVISSSQRKALNGMDTLSKSVIGGPVGPQDRFVREKQEKFAEKVKDLNVSRLEEKPFPLLHVFRDVEQRSEADNSDQLINAYDTLINITGETIDPQAPVGNSPRQRAFVKDYLDETPNSEATVRMRKRVLNGSLKFLENKFLDEVRKAIEKHPSYAQVGGEPTWLPKIRGYIRVKLAFRELPDEDLQRIGANGSEYPWVILFYLLRGGLLKEASDYVRSMRNFFQNNDRIFSAAITHYAEENDRRLSPDLQQKMNHVYAQRARIAPTNDPYRTACYKIIGRCELSRRNLDPLPANVEDYFWLQFNLAREGNRAEENAGETFGLEELQANVVDIGNRYFGNSDAAGGYGVYFFLSILGGSFESAIKFLYQHNPISAVHFAIALDYYGLLRVSDWSTAGQENFSYNARQQAQINFGRIVAFYTSDFRAASADAAAEYLILICLNADLPGEAGKQHAAVCYEALRELVLETREFSTLIGDVKSNGYGTNGIITDRLALISLDDHKSFIKNITLEAAKVADDNGRTNDAVLLNHLAEEYNSVVSILNRSLSEALSVDLGQEPLRLEPLKQRVSNAEQQQSLDPTSASVSLLGTDDPIELTRRIILLYDNNQTWWNRVENKNRQTLGTLYRLNGVKKGIEAGLWMQALDEIQRLNILPLEARGELSAIRASANSFSTLSPDIARNIGNVLLWSIMCCSRYREVLLSGQYEDPNRRAMADQLLQKAKDLMVFAGLIRYKLPPRVFEMLAREGQEVGAY